MMIGTSARKHFNYLSKLLPDPGPLLVSSVNVIEGHVDKSHVCQDKNQKLLQRKHSSCRDNESQHIKGPESLPYYQISTESGLEGPFSLQKHNEKHQDFWKILTRIVAMQHLALFLFLLISSKSFLW